MLVLPHISKLWVGSDDGRVWVIDGVAETLLGSFRPHPGSNWAVTALAVVGREVWSACERCLAVHDPESGARLAVVGQSAVRGTQLLVQRAGDFVGAVPTRGTVCTGHTQKAAGRVVCVSLGGAGAVRYTLPLLEGSAGFIKALLPWQWGLWVMSINGLRLLAVREAWEAAQQKVGAGWLGGCWPWGQPRCCSSAELVLCV